MIKKILLSFVMLLTGVNYVFANAKSVDEHEKGVLGKLAKAKNSKDSIKYLYDLYDLVPRKEKIKYARTLYEVAERSGRDEVRLDLLRHLSQLSSAVSNPDSLFTSLGEEAARIPRSQDQEETALFIRMRQVAHESRAADSKQVEAKIASLIAE